MITGKGLLAVAFVAALAGCSNHAINDLPVTGPLQQLVCVSMEPLVCRILSTTGPWM